MNARTRGCLTVVVAIASSRVLLAAAPGPKPRTVSFNTADGVTVVADWFAPTNPRAPLAILLHMYGQDRTSWAPLIPELHQRGYAILVPDLRGHGASLVGPPGKPLKLRAQKRDRYLFGAMHREVAAAYAWASEQGSVDLSRFALVGAELGGAVAIDYAGRDRSVDTVVCLSPDLDIPGVNTLRHIEKYGRRALLLVASQSARAPAERLAGLARNATVKLYPANAHGTRLFAVAKRLAKLVADTLDAQLGGPPAPGSLVVASTKGEVFYAPSTSSAKRLSAANKRWFSSAAEAQRRGYRLPKRAR